MHGRESKMRLMACKALVVDEISMISGEFLTQVRGGCCATNEAVVVPNTLPTVRCACHSLTST